MTHSIKNDTDLYFAVIQTECLDLDNDYFIRIAPTLVTTKNVEKNSTLIQEIRNK